VSDPSEEEPEREAGRLWMAFQKEVTPPTEVRGEDAVVGRTEPFGPNSRTETVVEVEAVIQVRAERRSVAGR